MVIVAFQPGEKYATNFTTLDQYDYGQILRIQGLKLPKTVEVHFSTQETGGISITRVGVTKDGVTDVLIPDSVLENGDTTQNYSIFAFVYVTDATSGKTEYRARLEVKARPKPEVPGGGDSPDVFHEAVLEVRKSAEKAEEAQRQAEGWAHGREDLPERAEDNAMYYAGKTSEDAKKTAQDRAEVERLVESVSGIDEQVAKVEKLSKNAQEAATQAETHRQATETASSAAQTAAQETETDRTAVEKAKTDVESLSTQVQKNKESVDKTAQDFTLTAQQALADVNNAGQAQTERVQTAGTTAVENIKTAQNTATQAVETAKTEAVKTVQTEGTTLTGAVTTEGEKQVQAVQTAAQEIVADREQINTNKEGVAKLKEDVADINSNLYVSKSHSGNPISVYISGKTNINVNLKDSQKTKVDVYHSKKNLINPLKYYSDKESNIIIFKNNQIHVQSSFEYANELKADVYLQKGDYVISKGAETNCNGVSVYRKGAFFANGALGKGASFGKFKVLEPDIYTFQSYTIPNGTTIIDKLQLETGESQTSYESYVGEVKSVELADKKGTLSTNSYIGDNIIYSDAETMDINYLSKELLLETNLLKNKTIIMNGDSICEDIYGNRVGWVGRIGKRNGMTWKNYGISGGTITEEVQDSSGNTKHSVCGTIDAMFKEYPDADYVIIEGGTNDADLLGNIIGAEAPRIGSFDYIDYSGTYDTHTFCGAFETICFKLSKYWKHAKVGYIVAQKMGVSTANGFTAEKNNRRAYFEKAIQICNKWGIPVLNLWDDTPLNPNLDCYYTQGESKEQNETKGNYYIDGQHLTSHGYDWTSGAIENWIKNL